MHFTPTPETINSCNSRKELALLIRQVRSQADETEAYLLQNQLRAIYARIISDSLPPYEPKESSCFPFATQQLTNERLSQALSQTARRYDVVLDPERARRNWQLLYQKSRIITQGGAADRSSKAMHPAYWIEAVCVLNVDGQSIRLPHNVYRPIFKRWQAIPCRYLNEDSRSFEHYMERIYIPQLSPQQREALKRSSIRYFDAKELEAARVQFGLDGAEYLLYQNGQAIANGEYIFILKPYALTGRTELFLTRKRRGTIQHSSMSRGGMLSSVGKLTLRDGKIRKVNNYSGHYQPGIPEIQRLRQFLSTRLTEDDLSQINFTVLGSAAYSFFNWLQNLFPF